MATTSASTPREGFGKGGQSVPLFFISFGLLLAVWAAVSYQTVNMEWGGIILFVGVAIFAVLTALHSWNFRESVSGNARVRKTYIYCLVFFLVTSVFTVWFWVRPAEHDTSAWMTTVVAIIQTLPLFIAGWLDSKSGKKQHY
ncbi:hypothetical protein AALI21_07440 [Corynebacteriaceae bacterium 6-324]